MLKKIKARQKLHPDDLDDDHMEDDETLDAKKEGGIASRVLPPAKPARFRRRHMIILASFLLCVVLPSALTFFYLEARAADQYASTVGFTVRQEDAPSSVEVLGALTSIGSTTGSDTDILYEFIKSQQLVDTINKRIDLKTIFSKPKGDPVFAFPNDGTIEDLLAYWGRMVKVDYETGSGFIEIRVLAFTPDDATLVAGEILEQSSIMINRLSEEAQRDATRFAAEELDSAVTRLKAARQAITEFRGANQMIDPNADLTGQMGVLTSLQQKLADTLIALDLLRDVTRVNDPRIEQAQRKIEVIEQRIANERRKLSSSDQAASGNGRNFTQLVGKFEELRVDLEFAEASYLSALAAYDSAVAEARRKSKYLAAYIEPTRAEASRFPQRGVIFGITTLFLALAWAVFTLVVYSVRDRR